MTIETTKCCAIMEIHNLALHASAEEAMVEFCKLNIASIPLFGSARHVPMIGSIYAWYFFTAACNAEGGPTHRSYKAYGREFADFIEKNKLGKVWSSGVKPNTVFHPDHYNQVWVWDVDHEALKTWWKAYQDKQKAKTAVKRT